MESGKVAYVHSVQNAANTMAALMHTLEDIQHVWDSRLYGPGASGAITDTDLADLPSMGARLVTADDLYSFVIFCSQFATFMNNGVPAQRDYAGNIQHIRTDI
jgi:hypothetical protein